MKAKSAALKLIGEDNEEEWENPPLEASCDARIVSIFEEQGAKTITELNHVLAVVAGSWALMELHNVSPYRDGSRR